MSSVYEQIPPLPEIGHPESYYAKQIARADRLQMKHAHESFKVGQYITLALGPRLTMEQKLRYFRHALRAHCTGPSVGSNEVLGFYSKLAAMVRQYAGSEAIRIASAEDDAWAAQLQRGTPREQIKAEATRFFQQVLGDQDRCPDYLNPEDWEQLRILRKQWL